MKDIQFISQIINVITFLNNRDKNKLILVLNLNKKKLKSPMKMEFLFFDQLEEFCLLFFHFSLNFRSFFFENFIENATRKHDTQQFS